MSLYRSSPFLNTLKPVTNLSYSYESFGTILRVPCRALIEVFHENLTKLGYPKTGSLFFCSHSFVLGSPGYPLPSSPLNSA